MMQYFAKLVHAVVMLFAELLDLRSSWALEREKTLPTKASMKALLQYLVDDSESLNVHPSQGTQPPNCPDYQLLCQSLQSLHKLDPMDQTGPKGVMPLCRFGRCYRMSRRRLTSSLLRSYPRP